MRSAYQQIPQSVETAMITTTIARVPCSNVKVKGRGSWTNVVVIYLVGMFGDSRAGNRYGICGSAIDEQHNKDQPVIDGKKIKRSLTYVDDSILVDPVNMIKQSVDECCDIVTTIFGPTGVNSKKRIIFETSLEAIGGSFDLISFTVKPKQKGIAKLLLLLLKSLPPGSQSVHEKLLEKIVGSLAWYAAAIPLGQSFIMSLYACQYETAPRFGHNLEQIPLSHVAQQDLQWWRALVILMHIQPVALSASIESVRRIKTATIYLTSDASSTIGCGAFVSATHKGHPISESNDGAIRWTRNEIEAFESMGISINVLEYFAVIYFIILWSNQFESQVVHVECDNTSAISWIVKSRAKGNISGDVLAKLFSLFCLRYNIIIICTHIAGVENTVADFRSRDLNFLSQEANEEIMDGQWSLNMNREESCRKLLLLVCVTKPETIHGKNLLAILTRLHSTLG